jgi:hypothetical protein
MRAYGGLDFQNEKGLNPLAVLPTPTHATTAAVAANSAPSAQTAGQPLIDQASHASHAIAPAPANLPNI